MTSARHREASVVGYELTVYRTTQKIFQDKGENAGYRHFCLYPDVLISLLPQVCYKLGNRNQKTRNIGILELALIDCSWNKMVKQENVVVVMKQALNEKKKCVLIQSV